LPCWVIGKYQNPRCFKGINIKLLDIQYRWNSKAWMTGTMFIEYIKWFNQQMHGRKVLLLIDNCPAHIKEGYNLYNTRIQFLPPNTTSKIQPCDAGIIRNLKVYYRKHFHQQILQDIEANKIEPEKIDILQAIRFVISAWNNDVKAKTIYHCFLHCKIRTQTEDDPDINNNLIEIPEDINDLANQINELRYRNPMDVQELLNQLDENEIAEIPTDDDIIEMVKENMKENNENNEFNDDDTIERPKITYNEATNILNTLELFFLQQDEDCNQFLKYIEIQKKKYFLLNKKI
jgi:DDE superfamily endonuclease